MKGEGDKNDEKIGLTPFPPFLELTPFRTPFRTDARLKSGYQSFRMGGIY
jgi:hypothetical protein